MVDRSTLASDWDRALDYGAYVATGSAEQQRRWGVVYEAVAVTAAQQSLIRSFVRPMRILTVSGVWCGDCIEQVPMIERIAEANSGKIEHRCVDRDVHKELSSRLQICGGNRVPAVLFLSEDSDFCGLAGDRTLTRYRAKAERDLGSACSTGLFVPPSEELGGTLADWMSEVERIQLMLRLSPRYRRKYED